jgi:uncharacterized protein YukE
VSTTTRSPQQSATALFNDVQSTSSAIERGDWLSAGSGVLNVAMDVIGLGGDPLGAISSAGFGFLLQHVSFLREPFDALLGDPNAISGSSSGWARACTDLANTAEQYRNATSQQTTNWTGSAGDAYRSVGDTQARNLDSLSKVSKGISDALAGAGKILADARKAVIDMISQACNKIIMIMIEALAEAWGSFGASIAKGIAQSVQTAVSAAQKMLSKIQKLISTLQKIINLVQKIVQLAKAVKQLLETVGGKANPGSDRYTPQGTALNYAGNLSAGTAPSGTNQTINYGQVDPGPRFTYEGYTPGSLPAGAGAASLPAGAQWGPSGPPPDRGHPASRVDQARWIASAVEILIEHGVDPSTIDTGRIAELVNQHSGGNPHAVAFNDPGAQNGYPAKGLMQLTDPVFQQHQLPGYSNIWQPVDNLVAGIVFRMALLSQIQSRMGQAKR